MHSEMFPLSLQSTEFVFRYVLTCQDLKILRCYSLSFFLGHTTALLEADSFQTLP
jgi:hypothetical protein